MAAGRGPRKQKTAPQIAHKTAPASPLARRVGGARNEFGTRISRRITCTRCGKEDHVPFVPKDASRALCRDCAAEVIRTYEEGVRVRTPTKPAKCNLCGTPFDLPITAEDDGDPLCKNCLQGFTTWRGSLDTPFAERERQVLEPRRAGTMLRKRHDD